VNLVMPRHSPTRSFFELSLSTTGETAQAGRRRPSTELRRSLPRERERERELGEIEGCARTLLKSRGNIGHRRPTPFYVWCKRREYDTGRHDMRRHKLIVATLLPNSRIYHRPV
jgi:hypothetical protein